MIDQNFINYLKQTDPELATYLANFNGMTEITAEHKAQMQNLWFRMQLFKSEVVSPFYEALDEITTVFAGVVGLGNGIQTADGEVYEVVVPNGGYTHYKHIDFKSASIARAKELGFEKVDKRKKL